MCIYIYRYKYRIQWDTPSNPMAVHSFKPPFEAWHLDISSISLWRGWTFPDTCRVARMDGDELVIHWWWEKTGEWKKLTSGLCGLHDYLYIYIYYIYISLRMGWSQQQEPIFTLMQIRADAILNKVPREFQNGNRWAMARLGFAFSYIKSDLQSPLRVFGLQNYLTAFNWWLISSGAIADYSLHWDQNS